MAGTYSPYTGDVPAPMRGNILSAEAAAKAAEALAGTQAWTVKGLAPANPLLKLLDEAASHVAWCNDQLAAAAREQRAVSPAAEWLLDNHYLVETQIRTARRDLPAHYSIELPRLLSGDLAGFPRVFEAVTYLLTHTDSRFDEEHLVRYVMGFQEGSPLSIGEVWALPIMLRIGLVENVRRIAHRVAMTQIEESAADDAADELIVAARAGADDAAAAVARLDARRHHAEQVFLRRLGQRLQGREDVTAEMTSWLGRRVTRTGRTFEEMVRAEQQEQAADQVSVANSITAIRFLEALDWQTFFERCCLVEHILSEDPAGVYQHMDFRSRDRYRHALEGMARRCPMSEIELAEAVISWSLDGLRRDAADTVGAHVGCYLIGKGRYSLERSVGYRPHAREYLYRGPLSHRGAIYWGILAGNTLALAALLAGLVAASGASLGVVAAVMTLAIVPMSDLSLNIVNRLAASLWPPRVLPKLDFRKPIADTHRTLVVVPALLSSAPAAQSVVDNLERAYLANPDPNLRFALLGDLRSAPQESVPGDAPVVEAARRGVAELNDRYLREHGTTPFLLYLRERRFASGEGLWMGWERKRGALVELTRRLRGSQGTSFSHVEGDTSFEPLVTFVITLDADTILPRDGAAKLVSTIAHPLNRARLERGARRVTAGYGLVQPRVGMSLPSSGRSMFAWLYSGVTGIDPYAGAVSDTYQDVFGEGSFTGKGIFEVDVFDAVFEDRMPDNQLLSHDLLEGCYLRTALVSDVEVYDDYPATYAAQAARVHRWVRGDWQTAPWLAPRVPTASGTEANPLSGLHRWKIVDNLRRSLFAPSVLLLTVSGWYLLPGGGGLWALAMLLTVFFPAYFSLADSVLFPPKSVSFSTSARTAWRDFGRDSARALLTLAMLPHQAQLHVDAIGRALWRMTVSKRGLLEWETAADAERRLGSSLAGSVRRIAPSSLAIVAALVPAAFLDAARIPVLAAFAAVWAAAPWAAWWVSRPTPPRTVGPDECQAAEIRRIARRTWRFFDTFVTQRDHWLAPDNFQEDPGGEVAHRTSPTNVGLQLLSYLSAYDLGYITAPEAFERTRLTLNSLAGLQRHEGHFYNWYDTLTLEPLRPAYVSTVDSGNLAGHLLVLRVGLLEASEAPLLGPQLVDGISDTVVLALEDLAGLAPPERSAVATEAAAVLEEVRRHVSLEPPPATLGEWWVLLESLESVAEDLDGLTARLADGGIAAEALRMVSESLRAPGRTLSQMAPWAEMIADIPARVRSCPRYEDLEPLLEHTPSIVGLGEGLDGALDALDELASRDAEGDDGCGRASVWAAAVAAGVRDKRPLCASVLAEMRLQSDIAREMWEHTDFRPLYDPSRRLFSIGYNTAEGRLDGSYYDILASECRLASFLAVAKGDVPQDHWFRLGRSITDTGSGHALVSWSASMFEYLMPLLVMRTWPDTLLDRTYASVVARQIQYGRQRGVPWGVSESAFNAKDVNLTYQYQAFGVPGLGLKRGLSDDVVIAPYASVLALQIDREAALANLDALRLRGGEGRYGFYESIDYTPARIPAGAKRAVVRAYFAHHQGMSMVALANEVTGYRMRERFHADPMVRSAELLLQERVPRHAQLTTPHVEEVRLAGSVRELPAIAGRSYSDTGTYTPATHFLSNGSYSVMVTNAGGGYSRRAGLAVTRYREDVTRDCWGTFLYVRDIASGDRWSAAFQPLRVPGDEYRATFSEDKAEYWRRDGDIDTRCEVIVSPEDDVEVRRLAFTNHGRDTRHLEVTSYFEIALSPQGADQAHRAFSNLFVETEALPDSRAVLFSRRPRSSEEARPWGFHVLACEPETGCDWSCETDRARFIGRLRSVHDPAALASAPGSLSGTLGAVIDPCCASRGTVRVPPGGTTRLVFATGGADTREEAEALVEKYASITAAQRAADLAWTAGQVELRDLGITSEEAVVFQRLASRLLLTDPFSPLKVKTPVENGLRMDGLWSLGISGDLPILLVRIDRLEDAPMVRQALLAHQYWRHKGLVADLVVLNTRPTGYADDLDERLKLLVRTGHALQLADKPGGVFLRRADQMHPDVLNLLVSVARATIEGDGGTIAMQLGQRGRRPEPAPALTTLADPPDRARRAPKAPFDRPELAFDNGLGGYDLDRREYVVVLEGDATTPAPWVNVIGRPRFGTMVSEAGIGTTWAENSHENRITTWNNDPVSDGSGELTYVRDEDTGELWSPTPLPVRDEDPYVVRHGRGYSVFEHTTRGIAHELTWFVPPDEPVRIARLRLTNLSERSRRLTVTHMVEWVLGSSRSRANQQVVTWWDPGAAMLTAHNHFNDDFPGRSAFLACDKPLHSYTASRTEFLGRNGDPASPAAMRAASLCGTTGRYHDNCGALMVPVEIGPGQTSEVSFLLGQTTILDLARDLVSSLREPGAISSALDAAKDAWERDLDAIQVSTPDPAMDALVNSHLLYQALSCRFWGRTATYQSSGAFGFRDQLQDCLALLAVRPDLVRDHIVEASRRQFPEGDVLHWWQPVSGRGVRTRFTDDRLWLPLIVAEYLRATGDSTVLDETVAFLEGPALEEGAEDAYIQPSCSERQASVYGHCVAAIEASLGTGPHGLPLMGGGDWNDGMNRVGLGGQGESVWMAWFLDVVLGRFATVAQERDDAERAASWRAFAAKVVAAAEREAWDGSWYRRAYFDDGTPLGSKSAEECRIDAIAQAWAVISGSGDSARAMRALDAVEQRLVRWDDGVVMLLTPPFDRMEQDPGYIKGYVPGVRENGGQYTHAAVWVALAHLMMGDGDEAHSLLDLINPVNHSLTPEDVDRYKVEPYVVAADVYAVEPHVGRGGWTWYTGSASWYHHVIVRHLLGLDVVSEGGRRHMVVDPCIPKTWSGYSMRYRNERTLYEVEVENPRGVNRGVAYVELDGVRLPEPRVPLETDGGTRRVRVVLLGG